MAEHYSIECSLPGSRLHKLTLAKGGDLLASCHALPITGNQGKSLSHFHSQTPETLIAGCQVKGNGWWIVGGG